MPLENELSDRRRPRLDFSMRREIADILWRTFAMISRRIAIVYDEEGITIRIPFNEEHDLDGPELIHGVTEGFYSYKEADIFQRGKRK